MRPNTMLAKLRAGQPSVGTWLNSPSSLSAEIMAHAGFDWLVINSEHSAINFESMQSILQAVATTSVIPMVRVIWNDISWIKVPLDIGAYGVVIPMVSTREDAVRAVQACRYPPAGIRGLGGERRTLYGGKDYVQRANDEIAVIVQIETAQALKNADEILSVPGIDAFFVGPNDLSASMGMAPSLDNREPAFIEALQRLVALGKKHGVAPGIHCGSPEALNERLAWGFQFLALGADLSYMTEGVRAALPRITGWKPSV